jgi:hypothetical protein
MAAYSYTDWASKSREEQQNSPGISIERDHIVNNPNRGVYWSATTSAAAMSKHIESTLAGEDRMAAQRMWNGLRQLHRQATESPRMTTRAMQPRQDDAHVALGSYNGHLNDQQIDQLASVMDDVVALQTEAQLLGIDPIQASRRMMDRAASRAVGYNMDDNEIEPALKPLIESQKGSSVIANLNQSVAQLQLEIKDLPIDAMDEIKQIGRETDYTEELREDHRRLNDILGSIPLVINPQGIEPEKNFSVRMETQEEATVMESIVRWAGSQERLPEAKEIHKAFASWRDNGSTVSPHSLQHEPATGMILNNTDNALKNLEGLVMRTDKSEQGRNQALVILTVGGGDKLREALERTGRPVYDVKAEADADGVYLSSRGQVLPANRIELVNLTMDQANDPIERSAAVNAVVGSVDQVKYLAGAKMGVVEAHALHLAGTLRKLRQGINPDGSHITAAGLAGVRETARDIDSQVDPLRYYAAGHARPYKGVNAVAFESAGRYDAANKANAPSRDVIGEAFDNIPENATILTVDNDRNAVNKWLKTNGRENRRVLYAEATRSLTFAEITDAGLDGEKKIAREANMELKIYEKPASERSYGFVKMGRYTEGAEVLNEPAEGYRRVCLDQPIEWKPQEIAGAIVFVSGNSSVNAINNSSQAIKVAQEAVMNYAHTAVVLTDMTDSRNTTDIHSAHMIRLAGEMGKAATVIDGTGKEIPLKEARERTSNLAENFSEKMERETIELMQVYDHGYKGSNRPIDVAAKDDLGQLALAALPGMDAARAIRFGHTDVTLREIMTDTSEDMRKHLLELGMPSRTREVVNDVKPWAKAMGRAIDNLATARSLGAQLHVPTDVSHPVELASGQSNTKHAVFTMGEYDYANQPVVAFIGNNQKYREAGMALSLSEMQAGQKSSSKDMVDPADVVDRTFIRRTIEEMTEKGYGIGVTLEEGVSRAVLEEAVKVPEAKLVIAAPGNIQAASPKLRQAMITLFEQDRASVMMPVNIAPVPAPEPRNGEERQADKFVDDRNTMRELLAQTAKAGIVVASSHKDQSLHIVKSMVEQDKPLAVMVPQDLSMAGSDLYSGNLKMLKGAGKTHIESLSLAQAVSANAYAEITDQETDVVWENGVRRGNAGTFQSAQLAKMPMARSGHHYQEMGWGKAAHAIASVESVARFVDKVELGEGKLGQYVQPTERELEARRLEREFRGRAFDDNRVSSFVQEEFAQTSSLHRTAVERDATMRVEMAVDEEKSKGAAAAFRRASNGYEM